MCLNTHYKPFHSDTTAPKHTIPNTLSRLPLWSHILHLHTTSTSISTSTSTRYSRPTDSPTSRPGAGGGREWEGMSGEWVSRAGTRKSSLPLPADPVKHTTINTSLQTAGAAAAHRPPPPPPPPPPISPLPPIGTPSVQSASETCVTPTALIANERLLPSQPVGASRD